jgi:hypothetical protein
MLIRESSTLSQYMMEAILLAIDKQLIDHLCNLKAIEVNSFSRTFLVIDYYLFDIVDEDPRTMAKWRKFRTFEGIDLLLLREASL